MTTVLNFLSIGVRITLINFSSIELDQPPHHATRICHCVLHYVERRLEVTLGQLRVRWLSATGLVEIMRRLGRRRRHYCCLWKLLATCSDYISRQRAPALANRTHGWKWSESKRLFMPRGLPHIARLIQHQPTQLLDEEEIARRPSSEIPQIETNSSRLIKRTLSGELLGNAPRAVSTGCQAPGRTGGASPRSPDNSRTASGRGEVSS